MKTKVLVLIVLFFSFKMSAQEQKMSAQEIVKFKETIENQSKSIKTIKTDFIQIKHMDFLTKDIETSGKMYFKSPNLLNWQYTKPYQYSIIFKNNKTEENYNKLLKTILELHSEDRIILNETPDHVIIDTKHSNSYKNYINNKRTRIQKIKK